MSGKFGGEKSKSTSQSQANSTFSNTSTTTKTPTLPEWGTELTRSLAGRVQGLNSLDPQSLVAPASGLHHEAAARAQGLTGTPWRYDAAMEHTGAILNAAAPRTEGVTASSYIDGYMNPYLGQVVDATAADLEVNANRVRAQQDLDLAGSSAFGGSGAALTKSQTEGELARAIATSLGNLRSRGWETALGAAQQDADRRQQAKNLNAQLYSQQMDRALAASAQVAKLAGDYEAGQRANVASQLSAADALREIDQQQRQAPVASAQQLVAMLSGLPLGLFAGEQTTTNESGTKSETSSGTEKRSGTNWGVDIGAAQTEAAGKAVGKALGFG